MISRRRGRAWQALAHGIDHAHDLGEYLLEGPHRDPGINAGGDIGVGIGPGLRGGERLEFGDDQATRPWLELPFALQGFVISRVEEIEAFRSKCRFVVIDRTLSLGDLYAEAKRERDPPRRAAPALAVTTVAREKKVLRRPPPNCGSGGIAHAPPALSQFPARS